MSTKIHATVDESSNFIKLLLTADHASEHGQANALNEGFDVDMLWLTRGMIVIGLLRCLKK